MEIIDLNSQTYILPNMHPENVRFSLSSLHFRFMALKSLSVEIYAGVYWCSRRFPGFLMISMDPICPNTARTYYDTFYAGLIAWGEI